MLAGAFSRQLFGRSTVGMEGKLSKSKINEIDGRLKLFKKCKPYEFENYLRSLGNCVTNYIIHELRAALYYDFFLMFSGILPGDELNHLLLLQYAMLLLRLYFKPVPDEDIEKRVQFEKNMLRG